ncbi:hypothetical protein BDW22DRAFT_1319250 [Trametopsis cervina]|nr:hypothetical protein BDW22DRAFT_1319250 [Trametopsis cervina]
MQDVSPSPTVSPDQVYSTLPVHPPAHEYTLSQGSYVPSETSSASAEQEEVPQNLQHIFLPAQEAYDSEAQPRKRQRTSDDEDSASGVSGESGESEREEDCDDAADDDYHPEVEEPVRASSRRRASLRQPSVSTARSVSPTDSTHTKLAAPVPVPNLTKKSRGRRVPTSSVVVSADGIEKNIRGYRCKVPGCNKHFQRGEHLKRHVRSIHTNEKPHKCPYKNCAKDFSRHDNLRQHMRVHRNEPLDSDGTSS